MDSTTLSHIAGIAVSLALSYIPKVKDWFYTQGPTTKRCITALSVIAAAVGVYATSCAGWFSGVTCDQAGAIGLFEAVIGALIASQAAFLLTPNGKSQGPQLIPNE